MANDRVADYTIKGFLYQFIKTIIEILSAGDDDVIRIEGIIEDIDISKPCGITAIQCKYHETKTHFSPSLVYKPILQMMSHFHECINCDITYILYVHVQTPPANSHNIINKDFINDIFNSRNEELSAFTTKLKDKADISSFLTHFKLEFGSSYDENLSTLKYLFKINGFDIDDIDFLYLPNAVQLIADKSILHDSTLRTITKKDFTTHLKSIKHIAITRWTIALKDKKQILDARKKQLRSRLGINTRARCFFISHEKVDDFDVNITSFISDILSRYHYKPIHIYTPLFCFDCSNEVIDDIIYRLHTKSIKTNDGYIKKHFDLASLTREPITKNIKFGKVERDFDIRIVSSDHLELVINRINFDDLYAIGNPPTISTTRDINIEYLSVTTLNQASYLLGVRDDYD